MEPTQMEPTHTDATVAPANPPPAEAPAQQVLAHAGAVALQDAVVHLRNVSTISTTAIGAALAQMLAGGDLATFTQVIAQANAMQENGVRHFQSIAVAAGELLRSTPPPE